MLYEEGPGASAAGVQVGRRQVGGGVQLAALAMLCGKQLRSAATAIVHPLSTL